MEELEKLLLCYTEVPIKFTHITQMDSYLSELNLNNVESVVDKLMEINDFDLIINRLILSYHKNPKKVAAFSQLAGIIYTHSQKTLDVSIFINHQMLLRKMYLDSLLPLDIIKKYQNDHYYCLLAFAYELKPCLESSELDDQIIEERSCIDYRQLKEIYEYGYRKNTIEYAIRNDKPELLKQMDSSIFQNDCTFNQIEGPYRGKSASPLAFAAAYGSDRAFEFLMCYCPITQSVCSYAIGGGSRRIIDICLDNEGDFSMALIDSIVTMKTDLYDMLIKIGNKIDNTFETAVSSSNMLVAINQINLGNIPENLDLFTHIAAGEGCPSMINLLVYIGADLNAEDGMGNNILHIAAIAGKTNVIDYAIRHKMDINFQNMVGKTALHCAIENERYEAFRMLLDNEANPNIADIDGITPLMSAATIKMTEFYVPQLLSHCASVAAKAEDGKTALSTLALKGIPLSSFYNSINTKAVMFVAKVLIERGSDINADSLIINASIGCPFLIPMLIHHGADINQQNADGDTALHIATSRLKSKTVEILLKEGAKPNIENHEQKTPLVCLLENYQLQIRNSGESRSAVENEAAEICRRLADYGAQYDSQAEQIVKQLRNDKIVRALTYNSKCCIIV